MADRPVHLSCPSCHVVWLAAVITEGAWWAAGLTPEKVATVPSCHFCGHPPPMQVYRHLPLLDESA